jgi:hypothetical protein
LGIIGPRQPEILDNIDYRVPRSFYDPARRARRRHALGFERLRRSRGKAKSQAASMASTEPRFLSIPRKVTKLRFSRAVAAADLGDDGAHGAEPEPRPHERGSVIAQESAVRWNEIAHDEFRERQQFAAEWGTSGDCRPSFYLCNQAPKPFAWN